jgi:predicted RNase H-like nuclease (RuvC/YqgF family)
MNIINYYNKVVKQYVNTDISEIEMLKFINTNKRNYTKVLNKIIIELKKDDVNFILSDIDLKFKKILQQRISYYNDTNKPTNEQIMKNKNILSITEFNKQNENSNINNNGIKSLDKEINWLNNLMEDEDTLEEKLKKALDTTDSGQKLYLKSIALDQAGKTKWALKFSVKAEELGYSIKNNENPTDIKRTVSGLVKTDTGVIAKHINMGASNGGQMPYNGKLGNEYDNTLEKNENSVLCYEDFCKLK